LRPSLAGARLSPVPRDAAPSGERPNVSNQSIEPYKFKPEAKLQFLMELANTGRKIHSAALAGVSRQTVSDHLRDDPEFQEAYDEALETYAESVRLEVRRRGVEGWLEPVYHQGVQGMTPLLDPKGEYVMETVLVDEYMPDEEGKPRATGGKVSITRPKLVPAFIRKYSDRMLELEAKRVDPGYREKGTIDMNVKGGILVVPGMTTDATYEQRFREQEARRIKGRTLEHEK
jgi:hypothetical protein